MDTYPLDKNNPVDTRVVETVEKLCDIIRHRATSDVLPDPLVDEYGEYPTIQSYYDYYGEELYPVADIDFHNDSLALSSVANDDRFVELAGEVNYNPHALVDDPYAMEILQGHHIITSNVELAERIENTVPGMVCVKNWMNEHSVSFIRDYRTLIGEEKMRVSHDLSDYDEDDEKVMAATSFIRSFGVTGTVEKFEPELDNHQWGSEQWEHNPYIVTLHAKNGNSVSIPWRTGTMSSTPSVNDVVRDLLQAFSLYEAYGEPTPGLVAELNDYDGSDPTERRIAVNTCEVLQQSLDAVVKLVESTQ